MVLGYPKNPKFYYLLLSYYYKFVFKIDGLDFEIPALSFYFTLSYKITIKNRIFTYNFTLSIRYSLK